MLRLVSKLVYPAALLFAGCYSHDIPRSAAPSCVDTDLVLLTTIQSESACGSADGNISVTVMGGVEPYQYQINGGTAQLSASFTNLPGGSYLVTVVDHTGCSNTVEAVVSTSGSTLTAAAGIITPDTDCISNNGGVTVAVTGGVAPYLYSIDNSAFKSDSAFIGLGGGTYTITVKDAASCESSFGVFIPTGTDVSYATFIAPLITAKCAFSGCHSSGSARDLTTYAKVQAKADQIKIRTSDGSMPKKPKPGGSLTSSEISKIACWVDAGMPNN